MAFEKKRGLGDLHAVLRKTGEGLYRADYPGEINPDPSDARTIPDLHVGTSMAEVKMWVEQMAGGLGYDRVVWDELPQGQEGMPSG